MAVARFLFLLTSSSAFRHRHARKSQTKAARVLTPANGDAYVHALSTTNRFCPLRCASEIVQPATTEELAVWLRKNKGKSFTVKGGGHSYACQSIPDDGGVMIHTELLSGKKVFRRPDGSAYAELGAGLTFDQFIPELTKLNYSMPHGECLTVGLGGWALNMGNHPELKNMDNKWGYNGTAFINKITMVSYAGSIFTVSKNGIELVELGNESWLGWKNRKVLTTIKAGILDLFSPDLVASGNVMKAFKIWGASLAIATEFEIELLPKPEPSFWQVTYGLNDILDDKGGRGAQLMKAIVDVVADAGSDPNLALDCGIFFATQYFQGSQEGVVALKCTDLASETGETVARWAPAGYRKIEPKKSGFAFWALNSYGKGWVPMFHTEKLDEFLEVGGSEKYRTYLRELEHGDAAGPNPCDSCLSELMYMLRPGETKRIMFDSFCTGGRSNQDACSAFAFRVKDKFLGNRETLYKQNLPSCKANPKWKTQLGEYGIAGWLAGSIMKSNWDPEGVHKFWLGLGEKNNAGTCEAAHTQPVGETCQRHGITPDSLVQAELAKVRSKCPAFRSYSDFDSQNNLCSQHIYDSASALSVTAVAE